VEFGNCELAFSPIVIDDDGEALGDIGDIGDRVKNTSMLFFGIFYLLFLVIISTIFFLFLYRLCQNAYH
jgi:hypothetical protein